jgi:transcriptional regulator with XRE-family HTH domain
MVSMTLADWRKAEGISQKEMASRLSAVLGRPVHQPSVRQWESGDVMPGADVADAIQRVTCGKVIPSSFGKPPCQPA